MANATSRPTLLNGLISDFLPLTLQVDENQWAEVMTDNQNAFFMFDPTEEKTPAFGDLEFTEHSVKYVGTSTESIRQMKQKGIKFYIVSDGNEFRVELDHGPNGNQSDASSTGGDDQPNLNTSVTLHTPRGEWGGSATRKIYPLKTMTGTLNIRSVWAAIKLDSPDARILQVTGHDQSDYDGVTFSWDGTFMKFDGRVLGTEKAIDFMIVTQKEQVSFTIMHGPDQYSPNDGTGTATVKFDNSDQVYKRDTAVSSPSDQIRRRSRLEWFNPAHFTHTLTEPAGRIPSANLTRMTLG